MKSQHADRSVKHWETRPEAAWKGFRFHPPYEQGRSRLQQVEKKALEIAKKERLAKNPRENPHEPKTFIPRLRARK